MAAADHEDKKMRMNTERWRRYCIITAVMNILTNGNEKSTKAKVNVFIFKHYKATLFFMELHLVTT